MITKDTVVVGAAPRINNIRFAEVLLSVASPATGDAFAMYDAAVANGIDPAFFLAIFKEESQFATDPASMVVVHNTHNPGNCRSSSIGPLPVKLTEKGPFVIYPDWATGADDATHRLTDKRFPYDQAKAVTIGQIIPLWAPARDGNIPSVYLANVVSYMNAWIGQGEVSINKMFDLDNIPFRQSPNYDAGGNACNKIIIHSTEGSYDSSVGWLLSKAAGVSAHYVISEDGSQCTQLVKDGDIAWHAGNWAYNSSAIGVEHSWVSRVQGADGQWQKPSLMPSEGLYRAGAALVARLCKKHNINPDRQHIIAHGQVPPPNDHTDPGPWWDWDRYMDYILAAYSGGVTVFDPNPKKFIIGPGVLETLTRESMTALTNEQYYIADGNKPGLPKKSFTYADKGGVTYRVEAIQDQDATGQPLLTWRTEIWLFVKKAA